MVKLSRKKAVQEYFSQETSRWDGVYNEGDSIFNYEMQKRKELVFEFIKKNVFNGEPRAIDVGCGAGHYVRELIDLGFNTIGSDISLNMVTTTRTNLGNNKEKSSNLICADCEFIPFPDNYFNLVLCIGVLSYVPDEIKILKELRRIIDDKGQVIISLPNLIKIRNIFDPYYYLVRIWKYIFKLFSNHNKEKEITDINEYLHNENFAAQNRYLLKQIYKYAQKSDFTVTDIKGYVYFFPTFFRKQIFSDKTVVKVNDYIMNKLISNKFKFLLNIPFGWVVTLSPNKN